MFVPSPDDPEFDDDPTDDSWDDSDSGDDWDDTDSLDADDLDEQSEHGPVGATHVFFENEPLIRALNDPGRSSNDPEAAQRLFRGLLDATLIALIPEDTELIIDDEGQLAGDVQLGFLTVRHETISGDIIPMFTDEGALSEFTEDGGRYVALAVRDLFPLLAAGGLPPNVVVNPGGGEALLLTPTMVLDVVQSIRGYRPIAVRRGTDIAVSLPADPAPEHTAAALASALAAFAEVEACWHFMWHIDEIHEDPTNVLAVELSDELDDAERRAAFEAIQDAVEPLVDDLATSVDLVDYRRHHELFDDLSASTEPLYRRDDSV